jgi:acetoin utilization deacetylase AcuC-like enzyme
MTVALFTHPSALQHDTGVDHPECPERIRSVLQALEAQEFAILLREIAPEVPHEALRAAHTEAHVNAILALPQDRLVYIDGDTVFSPGSLEAALRGAGGACAAVDAVMEGWADSAFVAMRPPGHHAERDRAMGFCLFNNAAIAAYHARASWGLTRIAVVDFDVHHGNGTQDIFTPPPTNPPATPAPAWRTKPASPITSSMFRSPPARGVTSSAPRGGIKFSLAYRNLNLN